MITLALIRKAYSKVNVDELVNFETLNLSNKGVKEIDNLELFADKLTTLDLSNNGLTRLDNLEFLSLETLMVQNNQIDVEGMNIHSLPRSLKLLDITGNPCCEDQYAINDLKRWLPGCTVITGVNHHDLEGLEEQMATLKEKVRALSPEGKGQSQQPGARDRAVKHQAEAKELTEETRPMLDTEHSTSASTADTASSSSSHRDAARAPEGVFQALNSDELLKELVDRKHAREKEEHTFCFDFESAKSALDTEEEVAIESRRHMRAAGRFTERLPPADTFLSQKGTSLQQRMAALRDSRTTNAAIEGKESEDFLARIRRRVSSELSRPKDYSLNVAGGRRPVSKPTSSLEDPLSGKEGAEEQGEACPSSK